MPVRLSTGLRNFLNSGGSLKQALNNGRMEWYSGTQPALADSAVTGTLLATITAGSASHTAEVQAIASIQLTGGASGNISAVTMDGYNILDATVAFNTSLAQTAADLGAALARSALNLDWEVGVTGTTVTLVAKPGNQTRWNGKTLGATTATITTSLTNPSGGAAPVNGLQFEDSSAGTIVKRATQTWSGVGAANGTAGWFRFYGPIADAGGADSAGTALRLDGSIATSGAQLNMSPTTVTAGATQTVNSFSPTMPAA